MSAAAFSPTEQQAERWRDALIVAGLPSEEIARVLSCDPDFVAGVAPASPSFQERDAA
ncbi:MAG: hypothetical protein ACR650_09665 [Methylocystis sp.]